MYYSNTLRVRVLYDLMQDMCPPWAKTRTTVRLWRSGVLSWVPLGETVDWFREVYGVFHQFVGQKRTCTRKKKSITNVIRVEYVLRPFIKRSESELLIYIFRSEKRMGLIMQSDFAKSDGLKSDLRIRWPKSSDFCPKSDDSTDWIIKSKNGIGL